MFLEMANKVMAGTVSIESFSDVDLALYMKQLKKKMEGPRQIDGNRR